MLANPHRASPLIRASGRPLRCDLPRAMPAIRLAHPMGVAAHSPCAPRIAVAIADDHPAMREGLTGLIAHECDLAVSGSAATGAELRTLVVRQPPCVLVMELMLR